MKRSTFWILVTAGVLTFGAQLREAAAEPVGTAFTYQGRLNTGGAPASGDHDFEFALFDALSAGNQIGTTVTVTGSVTGGLFTASLDFGAGVFSGERRWLEIWVRQTGDPGFVRLDPRSEVTPAPHSLHSTSAELFDGMEPSAFAVASHGHSQLDASDGSPTGTLTSDADGNLSADGTTLYVDAVNNRVGIGTNTPSRPLQVVGQFVSGSSNNSASGNDAAAVGGQNVTASGGRSATLGGQNNTASGGSSATVGGYGNQATNTQAVAVGGDTNVVSGQYGCVVVGGYLNVSSNEDSVIVGGERNTASADNAFVAGGEDSDATALNSAVVGGSGNMASGQRSAVLAGQNNQSTGTQSAVVGGSQNSAVATYAMVAGGQNNTASDSNSIVAGGSSNTASGSNSIVAGGHSNTASALYTTVIGGSNNQAPYKWAAVVGGDQNVSSGDSSLVSGGYLNTASGTTAAVLAGHNNTASGATAVVLGGENNLASGLYSLAAGRQARAVHAGAFVWADNQTVNFASTASDQFLVRATGGVGLGTNQPLNQLHVASSQNSDGIGTHVARIENTSTGTSGDGLAIKVGNTANPTSDQNFLPFYNGSDSSVGSIEGNGAGSVVLSGSGSDYAEFLPKADLSETLEAGDVVGVSGGHVSRRTGTAEWVMAISSNPLVQGNDPGRDRRGDYGLVGFMGQIPVKVRGPVDVDDYIVASGLNDGTAVAVSPGDLLSEHDRLIVGRARESSGSDGVKLVNTVIGLQETASSSAALRREVGELRAKNVSLEARLLRLEAALQDR